MSVPLSGLYSRLVFIFIMDHLHGLLVLNHLSIFSHFLDVVMDRVASRSELHLVALLLRTEDFANVDYVRLAAAFGQVAFEALDSVGHLLNG